MARYKHIPGIASIVTVDDDQEIDAFLDDPNLDRTYEAKGPPLNRLLILRLRHALFREGRALLSFAPRGNTDRTAAQGALAQRLDALADSRPWDDKAIAAMANYVTTGTDRDSALAGLTYATAYPFLPLGDTDYAPEKFARLFELFEILQKARSPWKGLPLRLSGKDKRAARDILQATGGDDYGFHAVAITLANSIVILDRLRAQFASGSPATARASPLDWTAIRTAPVAVTRQNKAACRLPGIDDTIPAHSLFLFQMRQGLKSGSAKGYEFASSHWSFCPASRYIEAIFESVFDAATHK